MAFEKNGEYFDVVENDFCVVCGLEFPLLVVCADSVPALLFEAEPVCEGCFKKSSSEVKA